MRARDLADRLPGAELDELRAAARHAGDPVSGCSDEAVGSEVGGDPTFLQKPFTHEDLTRTLRAVLDSDAPVLV